jgi:hypothetical protein
MSRLGVASLLPSHNPQHSAFFRITSYPDAIHTPFPDLPLRRPFQENHQLNRSARPNSLLRGEVDNIVVSPMATTIMTRIT